jgi:hypothetical protein
MLIYDSHRRFGALSTNYAGRNMTQHPARPARKCK